MQFEDKGTYYAASGKQGGDEWLRLRNGRITMSQISACVGRSPIKKNLEEEAEYICGIKKINFNLYMTHGQDMEPVIRNWYSDYIEKPIKEVGLAVWKKDFRFGGSLDGEINDFEGIEIKAPQKMYQKLINYVEAKKKGFTFVPGYHEHIFNSHYDQMTGYGVITGKKFMHYVVVCSDTQQAFIQKFPVDYELWNTELYPKSCLFYDTYVEPLMKQHGISRIDP